MTTTEAWRWVAHHWAYGMLRLTVANVYLGVGLASTAVKTARGISGTRVRFPTTPRNL